jgi:hypothetical protein
MPNYQNIIQNSAQVTVPTSDGDLHIDYYPGLISQEMILEFQEFATLAEETVDRDALRTMNSRIAALIKGWDLMNGEEKFPINADDMMILPLGILQDIVRAIVSPNSQEAQNRKLLS